jgi:2'-5' RNA ligase
MEVAFVILLENEYYNYVRQLQLKISQLFHAKETLKLEPHITIKYAFTISNLQSVENYFKELTNQIKPFEIKIKSIESFDVNVVFISIEKNNTLTNLHLKILNDLKQRFSIRPAEYEGKNFHFHITLAYKDIDNKTFKKIKDKLKNEKSQFTFTLHKLGIYLRPDPNENWFLYKTFLL